ncbi:ABC transporter ATP-binding protein [Flaviflexus equikiangi]|uniref:ABC transporter ATP-binding protein n=1 Tax=Flaviflexus equikiangi TaxID=2758573 RepID=A0ABS2TDM3_9ACTO|nr:ABC transporter ATP-binding protein [Flaviflexus equikiangi]MBM9432412.1 ABC transporter ATP-binding protein [Flaviflexus equikiangi]
MTARVRLSIENLHKTYPARNRRDKGTEVLRDINVDVFDGEFLTIVGPSGAGKTTLLRTVSGLLDSTSGRVLLDGKEIVGPPREIALVFQDYSRSLYPWMTVAKNIGLPLKAHGVERAEIAKRVEAALFNVGLAGVGDRYPWQLSGGMQQRVAIARAVAYRPEVMILDEPFASVDAQTRNDLEDLLLRVKEQTNSTFVFVTHDVDEAVYLSDRVAILSKTPSRIERVIDINLPRERNQLETRALPEFSAYRAEIFGTIRNLVVPADQGPSPEYSI